jgi:hypothetical protein
MARKKTTDQVLSAVVQTAPLSQPVLTQAEEIPQEQQVEYNPLIAPDIQRAHKKEYRKTLDLSRTILSMDIPNVDLLPPEQFTTIRRKGFGASDSSILLNVNPYQKVEDLIKQKASTTLTKEELEVATKVAVRKGNDLEPLIIAKVANILGTTVNKPPDQYVFTDYPYLKVNYDGVIESDKQYLPTEIKVATKYGAKHYNPNKAIFSEYAGWRPMPTNVSGGNMSIEQKAAHYGIPPYYYTQVQQEMMGLRAPYGYLCCMFDDTWIVHIFMIYEDKQVQNDILVAGAQAWQKVEALKCQSNGLVSTSTEPLQSMTFGGVPTLENQSKPLALSSDDY